MNPLFKEVEDVMDAAKRYKEIYDVCVPRRIIPPNGYANPRLYGMYILAGVHGSMNGPSPEYANTATNSTQIVSTSLLTKYKVPTYFVNEDFLRAVAATEPPKDTKLEAIKWPMPAMLFCLPLGFSKEYFGAVVPFISVGRAEPGFYTAGPGIHGTEIQEDTRIIIHVMCFYGTSPVDYLNVTRMSKSVESLMCAEFVTWEQDAKEREQYQGTGTFNEPTKEKEIEIANKGNALATKLLLALSARPEMREEAPMARPAKIRKGEVEKEALWHPNMIGRAYRIVRGPDYVPEGSHQSPKMHWRRGHFRKQKYGVNNSKEKIIWIDPVLVMAEGDEK